MWRPCRRSPPSSGWRCRWRASACRPGRGGRREQRPGAPTRSCRPGAAHPRGTRRVYAADWRHFSAWCRQPGLVPLPAPPATLAAYLAAHAGAYALATLRRRLAAIARVHREARHAFDSRDPAICNALRGIARAHAAPRRQAAALTTAEIRALVRTCDPDLAGLRDRALLLLGYAGALRRSELVGVDVEHLKFHTAALELLLPRSKGDPEGEGQRISIGRGKG